MPDTRTGRIYKIICSKSNDVYAGSTFNDPRKRMYQHQQAYKHGRGISIYPSFKLHGWESLKMILIETYEVVDRKHLVMYETLWFNKLKAVNRQTPFQPVRINSVVAAARKDKRELREAKTFLVAHEAREAIRRPWYAERKRINREYRSPYKLPAGSAKVIELERNPIIIECLASYRMPPLQDVIDRDIEILESRK
jgi:hypothetical protein